MKMTSLKRKTITILLMTGIVFMIYSFFEAREVKISEIEIKSGDIPTAFNGSKFVFITDIHHGVYLSASRLSRIVNRINALHPDFVLLGGDYVNRGKKYIGPVFRELGRLKSAYGTFGVLGNHDHWADATLTRRMMSGYGIHNVDNNGEWIWKGNDSIKIGGVGDLWEDIQVPENTTRDLRPSDFAILISHNPDFLENFHSDLIDLTFSGHTHGGQVTLFGLWAPILRSDYGQKYRYGLIHQDNRDSYISSGIGTVLFPFRFFCRPEIVVIRLTRTNSR